MKKFSINKSGFTLVEILVVVALIGVASIVTTQVLLSVLRSQSKGEVVKEVKQNGDYAYTFIEQQIRNAKDVAMPGGILTITNPDTTTTTVNCSSGTMILTTQPGPTTLPLTNNNVIVSSCSFSIGNPNPGNSPKYVYLSYVVSQKGTGAPANIATQQYQGTVSLRTY